MKKLLAGLLSLTLTVTVMATPFGESISAKLVNTSISASAEDDDYDHTDDWDPDIVDDWSDEALYSYCEGQHTIGSERETIEIFDYRGSETELVLPTSLDGLLVTVIGEEAFKNHGDMKSVTVPKCVTKIGKYALGYYFDNNTNSFKKISDFTIKGYTDTEAYKYAKINGFNFVSLGKADSPYTYLDCYNEFLNYDDNEEDREYHFIITGYHGYEKNLIIPSEYSDVPVGRIYSNAFANNSEFVSVTLPESLTRIGYDAFINCTNLREITIPKSVKSIGENAFGYYYQHGDADIVPHKVTNFTIKGYMNTEAERYAKENGFNFISLGTVSPYKYDVYNDDEDDDYGCGYITDYYGCEENVIIPNIIDNINMIAIDSEAFYNNLYIKNVTIPNGIVRIHEDAFYNCHNLKTITVPSSVEYISNYAFGYYMEDGYDDGYFTKPVEIPNFTIKGYTNSSAERYAKNNGFKFVSTGTSPAYDYQINDDDNTISITKYNGNEENVIIPSTIDGKKVTSIDRRAFSDVKSLKKVVIPSTVTNIGYEAFDYCINLTNVTIPDSVKGVEKYAFYNCKNLKEVTIPKSVTSLSDVAFGYTPDSDGMESKVENFTIKGYTNSVAEKYASENGLKFVSIGTISPYEYDILDDGTVEITSYNGEDENVTIPSEIDGKKVTSIGYGAFKGEFNYETEQYESNLISVTIPNSVTSIGNSAFCGCSSLTSITIPNSVTSIGDCAFSETKWLENKQKENPLVIVNGILIDGRTCSGEVTIPNGVTRIVVGAFRECTSLTSITIPNSVTIIGGEAFADCSSLTNITIPNSVIVNDDDGEEYTNGWFTGCEKLSSVKLSDNMSDIPPYTFSGCTNLKNITFPNGVKAIHQHAFSDCLSLTSITIPDTVEFISYGAFDNCQNLTSVNLPNQLKAVFNEAFDCKNLKSITIPRSVENILYCAFGYYWDDEAGKSVKIPDFKIKCYKGTAGEEYAKENSFDYELLDAHTHSYTSKVTKQPTCTATGVKTFACSCGDSYTETIPATGHKYSTEWTIDKQATCTEAGSKSHHCTVCGAKKDVTAIPATGHKFDNGKITKQPTETTTGIKTYTCTVCGATKTETIPKLTHTHSYTSEITKEPTCTSTGVKTFTCECGDSYTETIPKTSHIYKKVTVASTYFEKGYTANKCSKCGAISNKKYTALKTMSTPKASSNSTSSIKLSWAKVSGAKGYNVYQMKNGKWTKIKTVAGTSHTVSKLKAGTTYQFCIKPYTKSGSKTVYGNASKTLTTSTIPATVNFKLTAGSRRVTVKWSKVTGASGYKVYYKTSKNGSWKTLKTANNKTTSYTKTGLTKGKTYYFTVKAYRTVGGKTYNGAFATKSVKIK